MKVDTRYVLAARIVVVVAVLLVAMGILSKLLAQFWWSTPTGYVHAAGVALLLALYLLFEGVVRGPGPSS